MSVKLIYRDIAVGADKDATVTATAYDTGKSTLSLLPGGSGNAKLYATAEHNLWSLDGSFNVYDSGLISFWSASISDDDGKFSATPVITISLGARYTSLGISISFGGDCWCDDLNIKWYQGNAVLANKDYAPDALTYFCENTVTAYDKIVITLRGTSIPRRRVRIDEILFGIVRTFQRDELRKVNVQEEIDPTSRELAANSLDWTLSSKTVVDFLFQFKQPVYAYDGDVLIGTFYIDDSDRLAETIYDITCTDAIGVLDNDPFPDAYYSGANAYTLAQQICAGFTVEMESALQAKTVTGILKDKTRRTALQQLCFALGAVADTSGTDTIKIFTLSTDSPSVIPPSRTRTGGSVTKSALVTSIKLTAHSYSTSGSGEEVEINGTKYYDTKTVTTITNPNVTPSDKANVVDISDATLISPSNVAEIARHIYDHYERRDTHNLKFRVAGETVGDYVQTTTPWGDTVTGHYTKGSITLSGFALSDAEVVGE